MTQVPPKVHIDAVEKITIGNGEMFDASVARIGQLLGMKKIGCTMVDLAPGKRAWPFHYHCGQEEVFIVLEGNGTIRYDEQEYDLSSGEIFFAGTGPGTAHQIINTSNENLRYLAMSSMESPEVCYYPDSKKFGAYAKNKNDSRIRFLAHESSAVDYFHGE